MTEDKNEKGYLTTPVIYLTPEVRVKLTTGKWMIEFMNFLQNQTNPEKTWR